MKITRFELLWRPFIDRDQASKRVHKIMQNDAKIHLKSPQNQHEKTYTPLWQWSKSHAVAWPAKMHPIAFIFIVPGVALLTPWMQKLFRQNDHKKYEARCCIGQKHAPSTDLRKCIETHSFLSLPVLLCSRHGCKIAQNRRKSSMGASDPSKISEIHRKVEKSLKKQ